MVLVGNKTDLADQREVRVVDGCVWAQRQLLASRRP
jgi:hypothetical protein